MVSVTPTCVELFSGIGGFGLAARRAGFLVARACELDPFARQVYGARFPGVPNWPDVTTFTPAWGVRRPTVLCAGFPCQDLSVAGKRAGLEGDRSGLFWEIVRIAATLDPDWLLLENVPGLLSSKGGRDLALIVGALVGAALVAPDGGWGNSGVACGPAGVAVWRILDARWFGVPQRRRRWFCLVDRRARGARACEVLLEPGGLCRDSPPGREAGARAPGGVAACLNSGGNAGGFRTEPGEHVVAPTVTADWARQAGASSHGALPPHVVPLLEPWSRTVETTRDGVGIGEPGDPMFTLQAGHQHGLWAPDVAYCLRTHPDIDFDDEVTGTLRDGGRSKGSGDSYDNTPVVFDATQITSKENRTNPQPGGPAPTLAKGDQDAIALAGVPRRLTPVECERLQGFPDGWTNVPDASDSARYRALGNAVAVPVVEWILRRLMRVVALEETP